MPQCFGFTRVRTYALPVKNGAQMGNNMSCVTVNLLQHCCRPDTVQDKIQYTNTTFYALLSLLPQSHSNDTSLLEVFCII
jgi:hypothetical protein